MHCHITQFCWFKRAVVFERTCFLVMSSKKAKAAAKKVAKQPIQALAALDGFTQSDDEGICGGNDAECEETDLGLVQCEICEFSYHQKTIVNTGSKESPKYRDRSCHAACRWFDRAAVSQGVDVGGLKKKAIESIPPQSPSLPHRRQV